MQEAFGPFEFSNRLRRFMGQVTSLIGMEVILGKDEIGIGMREMECDAFTLDFPIGRNELKKRKLFDWWK